MRTFVGAVAFCLAAAACGSDPVPPLATAQPGVVFTYPSDKQVDVPVGTNVVVTFSEAVDPNGAASGTIVGPNGPVDATAKVTPDGTGIIFTSPALDPGTTYEVDVGSNVDTQAQNLPGSGGLFTFTTRADRPRAAAPALVAVNGADPTTPDAFRPMLDTSTIRLVFSEPLDPRSVRLAAGSVELVDSAGAAVPATLVTDGIHISIDPTDDLTADETYTVRLGGDLVDLGGTPFTATQLALSPKSTGGAAKAIPQVLRTRTDNDPTIRSRAGAAGNTVVIDKPLIGTETSTVQPSALASELGDPAALDGPIAFTIRKGQRLRLSGLDVALGGQIPVGISTGDIEIEFLTDGGGRIFRNPWQPADQRPEDERAPLFVDLSFDVAVYAVDATGNAILSQTVLGVQASGTVSITGGALSIETVSSMELGLLGIAKAPSNLVLSLITDASAHADADTTPPNLVATFPPEGTNELPVDSGIELIFDEPVDLDRLRAGGLALTDSAGTPIDFVVESHGATVVVRPVAPLLYSHGYEVQLIDVADVAGNSLGDTSPLQFATPTLDGTDVPVQVAAVHPGVPCALSNGHCSGGDNNDDVYHPFTLPADQDLEVLFTQPPSRASIQLGTACNSGSVRVEETDGAGGCVAPVAGTFLQHDHSLQFIPDVPWDTTKHYRLSLISGGNKSCGGGELCGIMNGDAASFDPLSGSQDDGASGGPDLALDFTAEAPSGSTFMFAGAGPFTDTNGNGQVDNGELPADANRAALRIDGTSGAVGNASFNDDDCIPSTPEKEACMYLSGAMPVEMGAVQQNCALPDGSTADACVPVVITPQLMFATSVSMKASVGISINTDTKTSVMRLREPAGGPITGYIVTKAGAPTLELALDLYMDAPDMSIPLSDHDLHSKPLSLVLEGPVTFLPDGRIAIAAANQADVGVEVNIDAPLGISGAVQLTLPAGEMRLQLVSPPLRGVAR